MVERIYRILGVSICQVLQMLTELYFQLKVVKIGFHGEEN